VSRVRTMVSNLASRPENSCFISALKLSLDLIEPNRDNDDHGQKSHLSCRLFRKEIPPLWLILQFSIHLNFLNFSDEPLASSKISSTSPDSLSQEFHTVRVSKRANKASLESLKDSQKTFTLSSTYTSSPPAAETCSAETSADSNDDVEMNSPQSDSSKANETVEQQAYLYLSLKLLKPPAPKLQRHYMLSSLDL
jgi:hypothetical protein